MENLTLAGIDVHAQDVSGQKTATARNVPTDSTVGELIQGFLAKMTLPKNDSNGTPIAYHALHQNAGRHLHASETVGDCLAQDDRVVLQPNIHAGSPNPADR